MQSLAFATWEYEELEKRRWNWKKKSLFEPFCVWRWNWKFAIITNIWKRHEGEHLAHNAPKGCEGEDFMNPNTGHRQTSWWQFWLMNDRCRYLTVTRHTDRQKDTLTDWQWQIMTRHTDWLTMTDNTTATNTSSHFCNDASHRQRWAESTLQEQQNVCIKAQK